MDCNFGVVSKKLPQTQSHLDFSPTFSSKYFIVLHFTFSLVIHFELMVVKSVRSVSGFTYFFCMWISVVPVPFLEKTVLLVWLLHIFQIMVHSICVCAVSSVVSDSL